MTTTPSPMRRIAAALVAMVLGLGVALVGAQPAAAATILVTNSSNSPIVPNSLPWAVIQAAAAGPDVITIAAGIQIPLVSGLLLEETVTIEALGPGVRVIPGAFPAFVIAPASPDQDFTFDGFEIDGNSVVGSQGISAVQIAARDITVTAMTFTDLSTAAGVNGAALEIFEPSGDIHVDGSTFRTNSSGEDGGALGITFGTVRGNVTIQSSTFTDNDAADVGGAVFVQGASTVAVSDSTSTSDNSSVGNGGFAALLNVNEVNIAESTFDANTSLDHGGAFYLNNSVDPSPTLKVTDAGIGGNSSDFEGGAIAVEGDYAEVTVTGSELIGNEAGTNAGAIYVDSPAGDVSVTDVEFDNNTSDGNGGAISLDAFNGSLSVERSTFSGNEAVGYGGGLYVDALEEAGEVTVHSSTFTDNAATLAGYALAIADIDGEATITNSTIDEEADEYAMFATVFDGEFRTRYSTIVGAILIEENESLVEIVSTIVDAAAGTAAVEVDGVTAIPAEVSYSLLSSALNAAVIDDLGGNQFSVTDMKLGPLQDNGGPTHTRMPLTGSLAIDKGLPGGTPPTFDQRFTGFPRVLGGRVDAGSVETQAVLAATGDEVSVWIPIAGGMLLLAGIAAVTASAIRRRNVGQTRSATLTRLDG